MRPSIAFIAVTAALLTLSAPAQTTATVQTVGQGCPQMPGYPADLVISPPVIGNTVIINPAGLPAADGILFIQAGPPSPPTQVFPGCLVYLDLATLQPLTPFMTGTAGIGWIQLALPFDPQLVGIELTLQAALTASYLPPASPPVVTQAAHVTIGDQT